MKPVACVALLLVVSASMLLPAVSALTQDIVDVEGGSDANGVIAVSGGGSAHGTLVGVSGGGTASGFVCYDGSHLGTCHPM